MASRLHPSGHLKQSASVLEIIFAPVGDLLYKWSSGVVINIVINTAARLRNDGEHSHFISDVPMLRVPSSPISSRYLWWTVFPRFSDEAGSYSTTSQLARNSDSDQCAHTPSSGLFINPICVRSPVNARTTEGKIPARCPLPFPSRCGNRYWKALPLQPLKAPKRAWMPITSLCGKIIIGISFFPIIYL